MPTKSPIIRRVQSYTFELIDFFDLYSHVPCHSRLGDCIILHVNSIENTVTVQSIRTLEVDTFDVRQVKLRLRDVKSIRANDIRIINNLALNESGFAGNTTKSQKKYTTVSGDTEVSINFGDIDFSVQVTNDGKPAEVMNMGFIVSYFIKNGFDLYGLIGKGYAMHTNSISITM